MPSDRTKQPEPGPLRILHVVSGDLWAGAESQFFQLVGALNMRPEVSVRAVVMNPGILVDRLEARGVQVDQFDERRESALLLARRLCRIAREWRPAIIHTHRRKEHVLGSIAALASGARAIATIHGRREFEHQWWKLQQSLLVALERFVLTSVHRRVVAVSAEMSQHLPVQRKHIVVIPNGVDVAQVRSAYNEHLPTLPGHPGKRLAFVGRLEPVKRIDRLVEAVATLQGSDPGRWTLFIIGEGSERPSVEAQVSAYNLSEHVHMLGFKPDPLPWLLQMDALIFASEHEGLPMTALEALALGVPVVSPAIGGLTALLQESGIGHIATSTKPGAIANAIRITTGSAHVASRDNIRPSAVPPRYTIGHSADCHIAVYREIAAT